MSKVLPGHPFHRLTNEALDYVVKDASEAERCVRGFDTAAATKYLDQINDAITIRAARRQGAAREPGAALRGDHIKTQRGLDVEVIYVAPYRQELSDGAAVVGILTSYDGSREINTWSRSGAFREGHRSGLDLVLPAVEPHLLSVIK